MKKCSKCGIEKPLSEFYKRKASKDGHRGTCKICRNKLVALYRQKNKDKIAEQGALYRQENKDKIAEYKALYRQENKDKIAEYKAVYYQENKDKIALYYQENKDKIALYYQENKDKIAEYKALYRQENKDKIAEQNALWRQERKDKEPACIYQIKSKQNGKIYVGETLRGELRWKQHLYELRVSRHPNSLLQEDFDKFGEEAFEWEILQELPKDKDVLLLEEIRTISKFLKEGKDLYNLSLTIEQLQLLQENEE